MVVYFKDEETMVIETEGNKVEIKIKDKNQDKNLKLHFPCGFEIPNLKGLAIHKVKSQERIINYSSLFFLHT